jgi:hypothetical protein
MLLPGRRVTPRVPVVAFGLRNSIKMASADVDVATSSG